MATCLLRQFIDEKEAFAKDLAVRFAQLDFDKSGELPASRFCQGIVDTDPRKSKEEARPALPRSPFLSISPVPSLPPSAFPPRAAIPWRATCRCRAQKQKPSINETLN